MSSLFDKFVKFNSKVPFPPKGPFTNKDLASVKSFFKSKTKLKDIKTFFKFPLNKIKIRKNIKSSAEATAKLFFREKRMTPTPAALKEKIKELEDKFNKQIPKNFR